MIILSTQGNTTYTHQITLICFSGFPRALMFCFYCFVACDKLETNNKNAALFYMLYIVYTFMFYVCVYCTFAITKHARHAKYSVYTYVHSFFIYVCIQFSLANFFFFLSILSQLMTNKQTVRIFSRVQNH